MLTRRTLFTLAAAVAATFTAPAFAVGSLVDVELVDRSQNQLLTADPVRVGTLWDAVSAPGDNFFAVKLSYWLKAR